MDLFKFTMLSALLLAFSSWPFPGFALASPIAIRDTQDLVARGKWGFNQQNLNDPNGPSITCMPTYNQQTADLGNPQLCSLSALQYSSGVGQYYIYDPHCKLLGGSAGQVSRHLSMSSQLPWTVELIWKEDGYIRWDTIPMLDYSYFHFDGGNATLACDGVDDQLITCLIPFTC